MLAKLPSYNTEPFKRDIYSKIAAVFLTMAILFRCLLVWKKRRMSACSSCFFLLAPTFISFKHQWQSDWAFFSNDAASRRLRAQPSVQSRGVYKYMVVTPMDDMPALLFARIGILSQSILHAMDIYLQLNREYYYRSFVLKRDDRCNVLFFKKQQLWPSATYKKCWSICLFIKQCLHKDMFYYSK